MCLQDFFEEQISHEDGPTGEAQQSQVDSLFRRTGVTLEDLEKLVV